MNVGLYARVSTHDQHTLVLQREAMEAYAQRRDWNIVLNIEDVGSGAKERTQRDALMKSARRREVDTILVWRLDRWSRSLADLMGSLKELGELGVGFVSLTEALDLTTSTGRAMAGLLGIFAEFERDILRERVKAGLAQARKNGKQLGRPITVGGKVKEVERLHKNGLSQSEIARQLGIGRTSVRRLLNQSAMDGAKAK